MDEATGNSHHKGNTSESIEDSSIQHVSESAENDLSSNSGNSSNVNKKQSQSQTKGANIQEFLNFKNISQILLIRTSHSGREKAQLLKFSSYQITPIENAVQFEDGSTVAII